jgi:hypothetical protein
MQSRAALVTSHADRLLRKSYLLDTENFTEGSEAYKLIIVAVKYDAHKTPLGMSVLLATLTVAARLPPLFEEFSV